MPLTEYLGGRSSQIRKDLVDAAELNRTATAQLADVDRKMQALPGELEALKTRGAEEIVAEEERIASAAAADRARLLTQTRREIEVRLQAAQARTERPCRRRWPCSWPSRSWRTT